MTRNQHRDAGYRRKLLTVALLAVFGPAQAADDDVGALTNPDAAAISAGV